jgi:arylsulfatase A-like enzyme/desulfoferrodoxin (superoxide reductase-like protein)
MDEYSINKNRPNVVMIFPDSMTENHVGFLGGQAHTPNIDSIFRNGMHFNHAVPNSPLCSPARYNLLTGRYASRCLEYNKLYTPDDPLFIRWNVYLKSSEKTIAHVFRENGYQTGIVGKWHLGEGDIEEFSSSDLSSNPVTMEKYKNNYRVSRDYIKENSGFNYAESLYTNNEEAIPTPVDIKCHHNMPWITKGAIDFIEQNSNNPFFLMMCPNIPHSPCVLDTLESGSLLTSEGFLESELDVQPSYRDVLRRLDSLDLPQPKETYDENWYLRDHYARMIWLDDGVGAVLKKLKDLDLIDNTIIIINTDHLVDGKMTCYRQFIPLAFQWNGNIRSGTSSDALVSHVDITMTILELCGCSHLKDNPMDGKSFYSVLFDNTLDFSNSVYSEVCYSRAIIERDFGYITYRLPESIEKIRLKNPGVNSINQEGGDSRGTLYGAKELFPNYFDPDQFYDYRTDINNSNNLFYREKYLNIAQSFKQKLKDVCQTFSFTYGEFKTIHHTGEEYVIFRNQCTHLYICNACGHLQIGEPSKCDNCSGLEFNMDDMVLYKAEEKTASGLAYHIPTITISKINHGFLINVYLNIAPNDSDPASHIEFIDFYRDEAFIKRNQFNTKEPVCTSLETSEGFKTITCIVKYNLYGYWQRTVKII